MELVRDILLRAEAGEIVFKTASDEESKILGTEPTGLSPEEANKIRYTMDIMEDHGLIKLNKVGGIEWYIEMISWEGQEFLDSVRDPEIWSRTKNTASKAGGIAFDVLKSVAIEIIKSNAKSLLGLDSNR